MSNNKYSKNHSVLTTVIEATEKNAYLMEMSFAVPLHGARFVLYVIQETQTNLQELHTYHKMKYYAF